MAKTEMEARQEGRSAAFENKTRVSNPYANTVVNEPFMRAWWSGWDSFFDEPKATETYD